MGGAAADGTLGTISGVVVPTCENMWGVLIFLRFFFVVGYAGVGQALIIVFLSFLSAFFTTMSLAAMATNGPVEAGGAYYIISRALGHKLGGAVGCMYYLGLSLLAVLEVLGRDGGCGVRVVRDRV
jgi:amino acid transporter